MIVSSDNRRLKDLRRLRRAPEDDRALLEGPHLVTEACRAGIDIEYSLASPEFLDSPAAEAAIRHLARPPLPVAGTLLEDLADSDSPRGLIAVARLPRGGIDRLPADLDGPLVLAEGVQDPGNLGALARSTEAAGGAGLALAPRTVHPNHPRALRGSAGSLLRLPVARRAGLAEVRRRYPEARRVALCPHRGVDLYAADLDGPLILLVGSEGHGLTAASEAAADLRLTIPLAPAVESLNTAVAAAVVLFEIGRRRRASG